MAYLSKKQVAQYFSVSERTVNDFMKRGLPHFRIGNKILRFKRSEVDVWFEQFRADEESLVDRIVEEMIG